MYIGDQFGFNVQRLFMHLLDEWDRLRVSNNRIISIYEVCSKLDTDSTRRLIDNHKETMEKLRETNRDILILMSRVGNLTDEKALDDFITLHTKFITKWGKTDPLIYKFRDDISKLSV